MTTLEALFTKTLSQLEQKDSFIIKSFKDFYLASLSLCGKRILVRNQSIIACQKEISEKLQLFSNRTELNETAYLSDAEKQTFNYALSVRFGQPVQGGGKPRYYGRFASLVNGGSYITLRERPIELIGRSLENVVIDANMFHHDIEQNQNRIVAKAKKPIPPFSIRDR